MSVADEVLALLATTGLRIFDGKVDPRPELPYVVVFFGEAPPEATSLEGSTDLFEDTFQTSAVGSSSEQVRLVRQKVSDALLDVRPAVSGRATGRIRRTAGLEAREDRDVQPSVLVGVDRWAVTHAPA